MTFIFLEHTEDRTSRRRHGHKQRTLPRERLLPFFRANPIPEQLQLRPARAAVPAALIALGGRSRIPLAKAQVRMRQWRRPLGWGLAAAMVLWLGLRLEAIGWTAVWRALPNSPVFYALVLAAYLVLPLADALIYRRLWGTRLRGSLGLFFRKRVYNSALVGYSGEVSLALWARGRVERSDAAILHAIKDVNLLSAVVSGCGGAAAAWLALHVPRFDENAAQRIKDSLVAMCATPASIRRRDATQFGSKDVELPDCGTVRTAAS